MQTFLLDLGIIFFTIFIILLLRKAKWHTVNFSITRDFFSNTLTRVRLTQRFFLRWVSGTLIEFK